MIIHRGKIIFLQTHTKVLSGCAKGSVWGYAFFEDDAHGECLLPAEFPGVVDSSEKSGVYIAEKASQKNHVPIIFLR
jgi:hypothetical protein